MEKAGYFEFSTMPHVKNDDFIGYSPNPHLFTVENYVERVLWIKKCGESGENSHLNRQNYLKIKEKQGKTCNIYRFLKGGGLVNEAYFSHNASAPEKGFLGKSIP